MCLMIDGSYHLIPFDRNPLIFLHTSSSLFGSYVTMFLDQDKLTDFQNMPRAQTAKKQYINKICYSGAEGWSSLKQKAAPSSFCPGSEETGVLGWRWVRAALESIYSSAATNLISKRGGAPDPGPDLSFLCVPLSSPLFSSSTPNFTPESLSFLLFPRVS